ncbi:MAG: thiol-disulfide oxidoreductase DCC family protein [Bacteroidetes bacterium]|nr:thiol-disulfide oxidoreductase DCC family protein [Bacteroidota bacterium]
MSVIAAERPILFFDGVCNFCNSTINFIIRHDKKELFLFAALQSEKGRELLRHIKQDEALPQSVILSYKGRIYEKSDAVLQTARLLGGVWSLLLIGHILPRFVRDSIYNFIARRRYRWFGKRDACMVPSPAVRARFLS